MTSYQLLVITIASIFPLNSIFKQKFDDGLNNNCHSNVIALLWRKSNCLKIMTKPTVIETESTLTDRYQTTIPASVRNALGLSKKDKICYAIHQDGTVTIAKNKAGEEEDPVLVKFLDFIATDIQTSPQNIQAIDSNLKKRVDSLVAGVEVNLDQPLNEEDE